MQFIRLVQRMPDNAYMSQVTEFDDDDESDDDDKSDDDIGRQDEDIPKMLKPNYRSSVSQPENLFYSSIIARSISFINYRVQSFGRGRIDRKFLFFANHS